MPQSLSAVYLHLVFSTKDRYHWLRDEALRQELHAYLGGVSNTLNCPPVMVGGRRGSRPRACSIRPDDYASRLGEGIKTCFLNLVE